MTNTIKNERIASKNFHQTQSITRKILSGTGGAFIGLLLLIIVLSIASPAFFTLSNLVNILDQVTVLGILAIGATAVILTGGIDLSVGAVLGLSTMTLGWLSHNSGFPLPLAMIGAIAIGALAGLINGLAITKARLPPFIATLAMMSVARGTANMITDGQQIVGYPEWFFKLSASRYLGIFSVTIITLIIIALAANTILSYRKSGRSIYAIGGSSEVARLAGIRVQLVTATVYVFAGALAAVGGIVLASRLDSSQPSAGSGYELDVIAAVVIGGASLSGGTGRIAGTVIGVLIIGVLRNGLNLLGVSPFLQQVVIGVVIAGAVMVDVLRRKKN